MSKTYNYWGIDKKVNFMFYGMWVLFFGMIITWSVITSINKKKSLTDSINVK